MWFSNPESVIDSIKNGKDLIILGDPGSGKTTFLKYLALIMAGGKAQEMGLTPRLPVLFPLSGFANRLSEGNISLEDYLAERFAEQVDQNFPYKELLSDALSQGKALVMLDGFDEIRDPRIKNKVLDRVQNFFALQQKNGNQFILTSRIVGYKESRINCQGFTELTLVDFNPGDIENFVGKWTRVIETKVQADPGLAEKAALKEAAELLKAVNNNQGVQRLATNPLLLTILCLMKRQGVTLPERRVQLYDLYVRVLLQTWNRARNLDGDQPGYDLDEVPTMRLLALLALWMHEENPGVGLVKREDLKRKLIELYQHRGEADAESAADKFLRDIHQHTCLLLERGPGEYGFIHLTFEEYLAGVGIAFLAQGQPQPIYERILRNLGDPAWREVHLLSLAYIAVIQQLDSISGEVIVKLAAAGGEKQGEAVLLAGEALLDAGKDVFPNVVRQRVVEALLPTMQNPDAPGNIRWRCGLLLGNLKSIPEDLDQWIKIPRGKFLMGEENTPAEINYDFWIAKYPLTNFQFARFIEAQGYENQALWSGLGWDWRKGRYQSNDDRGKKLLRRRPVETRNRPIYWSHIILGNNLVPVTGITWFEAEAYCNWLNTQPPSGLDIPNGYRFRLPKEKEWEYAARGKEGYLYPWGNQFDPRLCNSSEREIKSMTVVHTYPDGASPFGVMDLSGNIWEWQLDLMGNKFRVLRGGSWGYADARIVRCAVRLRDFPDDFDRIIGFRPILSLINSES